MCGIGGVIRWGQKPIDEEQIGFLLVGNEHRGNDASGIVIQQIDGSLDILKKDVPGWQLAQSVEYEKFIQEHLKNDSTGVLVHARGVGSGANPRDNKNNHPLWAGKSAVVHNGLIRNHAELFDTLKLERKADTDTDILRAIIDKFGVTEEAIEKMAMCSGSGAIASFHPDYPGKVLIVRSGNPLTLASNEDFFFFSSEKNTLHKACRPYIERKGIWFQSQRPNVDFTNMADHSGWIVGPRGLENHTQCHICNGAYQEPWRKTYEEYAERSQRFDRDWKIKKGAEAIKISDSGMKVAICPDCKKEWAIPTKAKYHKYSCTKSEGGCGAALASPIVAAAKMVN